MRTEQKRLDENYAVRLQISSEYPSRADWAHKISSVERWINKESAINKRVLRLRSYLYLKIPWFSTSTAWDYLLRDNSDYCLIPGNNQWITRKEYLGADGNLLDNHKEIFDTKQKIYAQWVNACQPLGKYAEQIYREAFSSSGYSVKKIRLPVSIGSKELLEIDAYCVNEKLQLGVQIKNGTSEVFTDPKTIRNPPLVYHQLTKQFKYCSQNDIIPILIAPFINKRFYNFTKRYKGLHCQTYLQLFSPEYSDLHYAVKNTLKFRNVKLVTEATEHVKDWINSIASARIGAWIGWTMATTSPPKPIEEITTETVDKTE
jgi:hypothetical protein